MAIEDDKNEAEQPKLFSKVKYKITGRVSDEVSFTKLLLSTILIYKYSSCSKLNDFTPSLMVIH